MSGKRLMHCANCGGALPGGCKCLPWSKAAMDDLSLDSSWDFLKPENLPPCRLCDEPLKGWITSDGVHLDCAQQYPDAVFG